MFPWWNSTKQREWTYRDTRTITLAKSFDDWDNFKDVSGISESTSNKLFFETLYTLYGNMFTKAKTKEVLAYRLAYYIEIASSKYDQVKALWEDTTGKKFGDFEESNLFSIGELTQEEIDADEGYDKRKVGRQTDLKERDILSKINEIVNRNTPFQELLKQLKKQVFTPYQKGYDLIMKGELYG